MVNWVEHYAGRAARMRASEIRELLKLLEQPDIVSFAGGIPDSALFPVAEIAATFQRILSNPDQAAVALQYSISEGYGPLRAWIAAYMGRLGVPCAAENVLITNGSQQALDFLGRLFVAPGDTILVNWPTYLGALQAFNAYEPLYDALPGPERAPESYPTHGKGKPKIAYVMPEFQNPSGTSLTLDERAALLEALEKLGLPLIEDNAYETLRYDGKAVKPMLALAAERAGGIDKARAVYLGTFSKSLVPAFRIGWIVGPQELIRKLVLVKQAGDLCTSPLNQMVALDLAERIFESHTTKVRAVYKKRRDALLTALAAHMPEGVSWTQPEGGMFVFVTLPPALDGAELLKRALEEIRVAFVPGAAFFPDRSGTNTIRMSFSLNDDPEPAIRKLGDLVRRMHNGSKAA